MKYLKKGLARLSPTTIDQTRKNLRIENLTTEIAENAENMRLSGNQEEEYRESRVSGVRDRERKEAEDGDDE